MSNVVCTYLIVISGSWTQYITCTELLLVKNVIFIDCTTPRLQLQ